MVLASADRSRLVNVLRQLVAIERGLCEVAKAERRSERQDARAGGDVLVLRSEITS